MVFPILRCRSCLIFSTFSSDTQSQKKTKIILQKKLFLAENFFNIKYKVFIAALCCLCLTDKKKCNLSTVANFINNNYQFTNAFVMKTIQSNNSLNPLLYWGKWIHHTVQLTFNSAENISRKKQSHQNKNKPLKNLELIQNRFD